MRDSHRHLYPGSTKIVKGITLVEASAGTGKTFAISMYVLRALVELHLSLDRILVVTFTVAATEELKSRIRERLLQGREVLRNEAENIDDELKAWASTIADKDGAVKLLEAALLNIDDIGVYTIHSFCQRVLREYPLESGQLFTIDLVSDVRFIKEEIVKDWWRKTLYSFDPWLIPQLLDSYADPISLYDSIKGADDPLAMVIPERISIDDCIHQIDCCFKEVATWWLNEGNSLGTNLEQADGDG